MRSQSPLDLLAYEASRKPIVKTLLDQVADLDDAAIAAAPILPWMRQALLAARQRHHAAKHEAALTAWVDAGTTLSQTPDPLGELWRWHGSDTYIALDRGALELRHGKLVWLPATGGVWIETIFSRRIDARLLAASRREGVVSKSQYTTAYRSETNRLVDAVQPSQSSNALLDQYGVRFSRPAG